MSSIAFRLLALAFLVAMTACATYRTPGAGVNIGGLAKTDADIRELFGVEPAAPFPARMAIARVQAAGYTSKSNQCYGRGRFCVVTTRDVEPEAAFDRISKLPRIDGLALMNRLLLPELFESNKDLRLAAATLKTDLLLIYSFDTGFTVENTDIGPLALISLGFLPNKKARVTSTASAAIFDVRTGFVYGVAEKTATEQQRATIWSTSDAIDKSRRKAETAAFEGLVEEIEQLWARIVQAQPRANK